MNDPPYNNVAMMDVDEDENFSDYDFDDDDDEPFGVDCDDNDGGDDVVVADDTTSRRAPTNTNRAIGVGRGGGGSAGTGTDGGFCGGLWGIICPPSSLGNKHPLDVAANIWCNPTDKTKYEMIRTMPLQEREKVWSDLSGNSILSNYTPPSDSVDETPNMLKGHLNEMYIELQQQLKSKSKSKPPAYQVAYDMDSNYATDKSLWLMYLRIDQYDCQNAVKRMLKHYEWKLKLFGKESLCKDLTTRDLSEEEQNIVHNKSNGLYWLPANVVDHANRRILIHNMTKTLYHRATLELRIMYILFSEISRYDIKFQKCGFVSLPYMMDTYPINNTNGGNGGAIGGGGGGYVNYELIRQMIDLAECSPIRFVAKYIICQRDPCSSPSSSGPASAVTGYDSTQPQSQQGRDRNNQLHNGSSTTTTNLISSQSWINVIDFAAYVVQPYLKIRTRIISGSYQECCYKLMCVGIPPNALPSSSDTSTSSSNDNASLQQQSKIIRLIENDE